MTAMMGEPNRRRTKFIEFAITAGHYNYHVTAIGCCIISAQNIVAALTKGAINTIIGFVSAVAIAAMILTLLAEILYHDRNMCLRDITGSKVLLNPQGEVVKHDRKLRTTHWPTPKKIAILFLAVGLTYLAAPAGKMLHFPLAGAALTIAGLAMCLYLMFAFVVHKRLYPWCPYCRRDDGPEDDTTPTPAPTPDPSIKIDA